MKLEINIPQFRRRTVFEVRHVPNVPAKDSRTTRTVAVVRVRAKAAREEIGAGLRWVAGKIEGGQSNV